MMDALLPALIRRECIELDRLVETCVKRYSRRTEFIKASAEDVLADSLATCLHSFYTGIERIFETIVRNVDGARSQGPEWHRELLNAVSVEQPGLRPAVLSEESFAALEELRAFRHLFRHLYTHHLDASRIFGIMEDLEPTWRSSKADLLGFLHWLETVP
jgi:hypothetical protein